MDDKVRENRVRRAAERQGLTLRKSRRRDHRSLEYGRYWLIDPVRNQIVKGGNWGMSLEDVEAALDDEVGKDAA